MPQPKIPYHQDAILNWDALLYSRGTKLLPDLNRTINLILLKEITRCFAVNMVLSDFFRVTLRSIHRIDD